ncbi:hypothetical protein B4U79_18126 [Dinothrombium tinctorium]|uniref:Uroporphyrinogen-III synthase n=1 Tax=Dinothrombium tinctorium TaxID=1965070 RepID=A0A3S3PBR2_9ACAR|nr:hypothetical protein B4U79_18126 [Dinothrombium tinctorium]
MCLLIVIGEKQMPGEKSDESSAQTHSTDQVQVRPEFDCNFVVLFRGEASTTEEDEYVAEFQNVGLQAIHIPVLTFEYKNLEQLEVYLQNSDRLSAIIFTSPRCVNAVEKALKNETKTKILKKMSEKFLFCVGVKTAKILEERLGLKSSLGEDQKLIGSKQDLSNYLIQHFSDKLKLPVFIPCSSLTDRSLVDTLETNHLQAISLHVYETLPDPNLAINIEKVLKNRGERIALYVFYSPSGVDSVLSNIDSFITHQDKYIAIGKTTAEHLIKRNRQVWCVSEKPTAKSLLQAVLKRFLE